MSANRDNWPSLWGGIECSVTRIGDKFRDQIELTGHAKRLKDLEMIKDLGLQTIRYPLLWERVVNYHSKTYDWSWSDERISRLVELNITPIIGLLHHGSGPSWTSLLDPDFPKYFADYAYDVACRYPFLSHYTPINEPLTTARFSGLYGHWYPHERSDHAFAKILLNECEATIRAMEAIRSINPLARHVQTEDLGIVLSTPPMRYQADFENARRWLSIDILTGRFDPKHNLMPYLEDCCKLTDEDFAFFYRSHKSPDVLGFNHYITSNRFLDHRYEKYSPNVKGSNGRDIYADVEAIRVNGFELITIEDLFSEAWNRYHLPLAVTETHLTCTPEEQVRWLTQCWESTCALKQSGVDIRAMTVWAIFGLFDWDTLTVRENNNYEPGVFSLQNGKLSPTLLANAIKEIVFSGSCKQIQIVEKGWWEREERFLM